MGDKNVVYVVLMSGRELIGELIKSDTEELIIQEPLAMDALVDEEEPTRRMIFMSRFSPYSSNAQITLKQTAVAMVAPASQLVTQYYNISLQYCQQYSDEQFDDGICETIEHINDTLNERRKAGEPEPPKPVAMSYDTIDNLWTRFSTSPSSNTIN